MRPICSGDGRMCVWPKDGWRPRPRVSGPPTCSRASTSPGSWAFFPAVPGDLFDFGADGARAWSVTPTVSWAAFDFGSLRARLKASEAQADAALTGYHKAVLVALEDTENSLTAYAKEQNRLHSLVEQTEAAGRAADMAAVQYRAGAADFLDLLDAQRIQLEAEDDVAASVAAVNVSVAGVCKALGGVGQPDVPYLSEN